MRDSSIRIAFGALLATTALATPAQAQISSAPPPRFSQVDENGVDLTTGLVSFSLTQGSIGSGAGAIRFDLIWAEDAGWVDNWTGGLYTATINGQTVTVVQIAGNSDTFTQSGGIYTPQKANGATLTQSGNSFTYKAPDGTYIYFNDMGWHPFAFTCPGALANSCRIPSTIVRPNGLKYYIGFDEVTLCLQHQPGEGCVNERTYFRFGSVSSSGGYLAYFRYATDNAGSGTAPVADWFKRTGLAFYNVVNPPASTPTVTYSYPASGVLEVADAANRTWRLTTNASGRLSGIRRPGSGSDNVTYVYGAANTVTSATRDGVTTTYNRSVAGNVVTMTVTNALSQQTVIVSDLAKGRPTSITDALNRTTSYQYDANSRLTRTTEQEGNYSQLTYDARGNVTERRAVSKTPGTPSDIVTLASFDATCANPVKCNRPNSTTDARGNTTDYVYDTTHGGVTSITLPAPSPAAVRPQTRISYAGVTGAQGDIVQLPSRVGACQTLASCTNGADETVATATYNSNLVMTSASRGSGDGALTATQGMTYDPIGNLLTVDGPLAGSADTTRYRYDAARQVTGLVGPDSDGGGSLKHRAIKLTYRPDGQVSKRELGTVNSQSDPDWAAFSIAQEVQTAFDDHSRPIRSTVASGGTAYSVTQRSYDALGRPDCQAVRMTYVSLPTSACTQQAAHPTFGPDRISKTVYDAAGQVSEQRVAVGVAGEEVAEATFTYTGNGRLQTVKDAENNLTTYEYDGFDRLRKTRFPVTSKGANQSSATDFEELAYDANGNVTSRIPRGGSAANPFNYVYDAINRMTAKGPPNPEPTTQYTYDNLGRLLSAAKTTGESVSFTYDALGRSLTQTGPQGTICSNWDVAGRRTRLVYAGACASPTFWMDYDYFVTGEMTRIRENGAASGAGVLATFAYDQLGRRASLTRGNGRITSYEYDPVSRLAALVNTSFGSPADVRFEYGYNPASQIVTNWRSNDGYAWTGHGSGSTPYFSDGRNQLTQIGFGNTQHDARGNVTFDPTIGKSYSYSSENLLTSTAGGTVATLTYDPAMRLHQVTGAITTRFAYDGLEMIAEYNGANALQRRFVHGPRMDEPLVQYEGSGTSDRRWLEADERGSIIAISDGSGNVTLNRYDEYGKPLSSNVGRFQYTGQTWLGELSAYHYRARIYSPTFGGRFLQTDPIGYGGRLNLYAYVGNDPINFVDPLGLDPQCLFLGGQADDIEVCGTPITNDLDRSPNQAAFTLRGGDPVGRNPGERGENGGEDITVVGQRPARPNIILASKSYFGPSFCTNPTIGGRNIFNPFGRINSDRQGGFSAALSDVDRIASANNIPPLGNVVVNFFSTAVMTNFLIPWHLGEGWMVSRSIWSGYTRFTNSGLTFRYNAESGFIRVDIPSGFQLPDGRYLEMNETCHYK